MEHQDNIPRIPLHINRHELDCLEEAVVMALKDVSDPKSYEFTLSEAGQLMARDIHETGTVLLEKIRTRQLEFTDKEIDLFQIGLYHMISLGEEMMGDKEFMATRREDQGLNIINIYHLAKRTQRKLEEVKGKPFVVPPITDQSMAWMAKNYPPAHN